MVEKAEERVVFSLDDKRLPIRGSISNGIKDTRRSRQSILPRAIIFSFRINDRHFGEEDVRVLRTFVRYNNESDMSP